MGKISVLDNIVTKNLKMRKDAWLRT